MIKCENQKFFFLVSPGNGLTRIINAGGASLLRVARAVREHAVDAHGGTVLGQVVLRPVVRLAIPVPVF